MQNIVGQPWVRHMQSVQVHHTSFTQWATYAWISDWIVTTQKLSWQAEADTHIICHIHSTRWSSTPCAKQERRLYTWTAEALTDVMSWVCTVYVALISISACFSRYSLCQSFNVVSVGLTLHCWHSIYVASPHCWRIIGGQTENTALRTG